jgi:predicted pyridoxine 5'-phosphate oxidase superfamily flavin-nucleotide-binding protein
MLERTHDVSPKGGAPGFVRVLDEHPRGDPRLAGNNLLDSLENIVANPTVGLIFVCRSRRVSGRRRCGPIPSGLRDLVCWRPPGR